MPYTTSPNMSLTIPGVGTEAGPAYATDVNNSLTLIDQHNHTPGYGVQIPVGGLNIQGTLTFNNNVATALQATQYQAQSSLSLLQSVYVKGVDLYYNDGNGNTIQLTLLGNVNTSSSGGFTGLVAPAAAIYSSGTFKFQSNTGLVEAANLDAASVTIRKTTASSAGITLAAPSALASDYTLTLPATAPSSLSFVTEDTSGNLGNGISTVGGITRPMIATQTVVSSGTLTWSIASSVLYSCNHFYYDYRKARVRGSSARWHQQQCLH